MPRAFASVRIVFVRFVPVLTGSFVFRFVFFVFFAQGTGARRMRYRIAALSLKLAGKLKREI
ncbi:hypothetical protein C0Z16_26965 [Paraburkholderia rhynchosiae]|uniref:Secreted protein n=1 Tax=Paraburkholderia rhynchosiae TaxID=487049 RepID=A0ABX4V1M8_9BURK|nr:hypothetical protein C0Z16_26965 [Paraburkholderia rhynchosiae]